VVGEPGVGKSRLVWEVTHSSYAHGWRVLQAVSVSYGKATSYLPVIDLLKGYFQIQDRDELHEIREKMMGEVLRLDQSLEPALLPLLTLLDVPVDDTHWKALDPGQRRRRTLDALRQVLLREARRQPLLLIFEDLHWIDGETQAVLDSVVESLPAVRVLLLVNYRPEYNHGWGSKTYYRQLRIDPLKPENANELLDGLLGTDAGLSPLKQLLIDRTEANPLFLEESVRALVETGALAGERGSRRFIRPIEQLKIPETVQAILAARIDRLAPEAKRLLQAAAVIGKDVPMALLLAIAEAPVHEVRTDLARLQAAEFLYEVRLFPDPEYTFKHALTHEVAYRGLLQDRQRALHARIVEAIERLSSDRMAEHAERLAHHALRGELWEKAVAYLRQAGLRAMSRGANREAVVYLDQALAALSRLPETWEATELTIDIHVDVRTAHFALGDWARMADHLHEAEVLARRLGDQSRLGRIATFMVMQCNAAGDYDEALRFGQEALSIAATLRDRSIEVVATGFLGFARMAQGEFSDATNLFERNVALEGEERTRRFGAAVIPSALAEAMLSVVLSELGGFHAAIGHAKAAIQIAEVADHPYTLNFGLCALGLAHLRSGDFARATPLLERCVSLCRTASFVDRIPYVVAILGVAYALAGRADEALPLGTEVLETFRRRPPTYNSPGHSLLCAATICLLAGRINEATAHTREALALTHRLGARSNEAHALYLTGETVSTGGNVEDAEGYYRQALALAAPRGMRPLVAHCHLGLGKMHHRLGNPRRAQAHLTIAMAMYREMGMTYWLGQVEAEMRQLC
jgi:tetratricopeptide (TPR) repeat protein